MKRTRLGISVGLLGSAVFFSGLFGGYVITIMLTAYILLFEENVWLKRAAVKATALMIGFSVLLTVINLVPDAIDLVDGIIAIFGGYNLHTFIDNVFSAISSAILLIREVLFLILGIKALSQGTVNVQIIDGLVHKHMEQQR